MVTTGSTVIRMKSSKSDVNTNEKQNKIIIDYECVHTCELYVGLYVRMAYNNVLYGTECIFVVILLIAERKYERNIMVAIQVNVDVIYIYDVKDEK